MGKTMSALTEQCTCLKTAPEQELFNEFFNEMTIRSKPCKDWYELIKSKKVQQSKEKMADKKWLLIIEAVLTNDKHKEESLNYWQRILQYVRDKYVYENYLYLSVFFLCTRDKDDFVCYFSAFLEKYFKGEDYDKESKSVNVNVLKCIITCYVDVISKGCVEEVKQGSGNKIEFAKMYNECYKDGNIEVYVEKVVSGMKEGEWVSVERFCNENYERLWNGEEIRKELERIENGTFNGEGNDEANKKGKETEEDMEEKLVL